MGMSQAMTSQLWSMAKISQLTFFGCLDGGHGSFSRACEYRVRYAGKGIPGRAHERGVVEERRKRVVKRRSEGGWCTGTRYEVEKLGVGAGGVWNHEKSGLKEKTARMLQAPTPRPSLRLCLELGDLALGSVILAGLPGRLAATAIVDGAGVIA
jgi:hypothetical protein